jgi:hypothetical protein
MVASMLPSNTRFRASPLTVAVVVGVTAALWVYQAVVLAYAGAATLGVGVPPLIALGSIAVTWYVVRWRDTEPPRRRWLQVGAGLAAFAATLGALWLLTPTLA